MTQAITDRIADIQKQIAAHRHELDVIHGIHPAQVSLDAIARKNESIARLDGYLAGIEFALAQAAGANLLSAE